MATFSNEVIKLAQETEKIYGVPASVTLAQYALESNYGKSNLAVNHNNYFGITGKYNGKYVMSGGREWRKYPSMSASFYDHGRILSSPLYANKTANAKTVNDYVYAIAETYAPSSDGNNSYAGNLMKIINDNNLTQYDSGIYGAAGVTDSAQNATNLAMTEQATYFGDKAASILAKSFKVVVLILVGVLAFIFFIQAFNITISPKKKAGKAVNKLVESGDKID